MRVTDGPFTCPNCGADVPAQAQACPECGSDEKTGWSVDTVYDGTGIEDPAEFDYETWRRQETGVARPTIGWWWWLVALLALILVVWLLVVRG